jgi:helicase
MKTSAFKHFQLPFEHFNKAQEAVVPFLDKDVNLIIAFNTSVGKTALAECAFGYHLKRANGTKVIYTSPYKSISEEKYASWSKNPQFGKKYKFKLDTSDYSSTIEDFEKSRIMIMTTESLDAKTRSKSHWNWLREVECIVIDEAHMLGIERRGSKLEAFMMRITKINPSIRIILLSATMTNSLEMAKWVKKLNGKETKHIKSSWRPCVMDVSYHAFDYCDGYSREDKKINMVFELIKDYHDEKLVIFVHSKVTGSNIIKKIVSSKLQIKCAFHNGSLSKSKKKEIEEKFKDPNSGLNVLVSTSTLSAGVNL